MSSVEGPFMTMLQEFHGAVLEVHIYEALDQGLAEVLV